MNKKNFKNVLVVLGGISGERTVSLDTGKACIKALKKKGYSVYMDSEVQFIEKNDFW